MPQLRKELTDHLRPFLKPPGFTQDLVDWIDAWADRAGVPRDGADGGDVAAGVAGGITGAAAALAPPPAAAPSPAGDDRYLPLFRHLARSDANPGVVQAMARSFAAHAPAYGQDASKARIAEFVAQISNETGGFTTFEENLNYSAQRLTQVWPNRFPNIAAATPYARNPEALANKTYGSRGGNRGEASGDGWRYRGRGALQLTFLDNYRLYGQLTGLDLVKHPELAADPTDSVLIALAFFKKGNVNAAIDRGDFREARRITNGAALGLEEVARLRAKAMAFLS